MPDFYKLTAVSLKSQVLKAPPEGWFYRNYKSFYQDNFNKDLKLDYLEELDVFNILNTPIKTKTLGVNSHQFMINVLWKAVMTISSFKNIYLKSQNEENWVNYKKQRSFCSNLFKKTRKILLQSEHERS